MIFTEIGKGDNYALRRGNNRKKILPVVAIKIWMGLKLVKGFHFLP